MTAAEILINGEPFGRGGEDAAFGPLDRGLHYGDGLFETIRVEDGSPEFWDRHLARLAEGCERLGVPVPEGGTLGREAGRLCAGHGRCVLKIIVTRGAGGRGYRPPERPVPTRILSRHPWPDYAPAAWREGVVVRVCTTRLATQPLLAGIKHLNRLEQVMARREWDDPVISEGLMLDTEGFVVDGTMSNLFIVAGGRLATPDLSLSGVAGVMRAVVLEAAARLKVPAEVTRITLDRVRAADEVFLTNSLIRIWPVRELGKKRYVLGGLARRLAEEIEAVSKTGPVFERP